MNMTPDQLRFLREQRGLTREQLAAYLGDCTASTVNKWERGGRPIPRYIELAMRGLLCEQEHKRRKR